MGQPYHEGALRYLLAVERRRAARADRPLLIMLVSLKRRTGMSARIDPATSDKLFAALSASVREVDFVGWYRQDRVIGAVLDRCAAVSADDVTARIAARLIDHLGDSLDPPLARSLKIKVVEVIPGRQDDRLRRASGRSGSCPA